MTAPFRSKPPVFGNDYKVNEDPARLDRVYNNLLGADGDEMLTEEVKWLAVTHKSFDHGRRGYNDRLSFIGRRIVELQASLALLQGGAGRAASTRPDGYDREPFKHPALEGLESLTEHNQTTLLSKERVAGLGKRCGLDGVIRWKPKNARDLWKASGFPLIIQQTLYAIVGAVALQRGGQVANETVRDRILSPLGAYQRR